jgi:TatD-related deoxyribonuclease
VLLSLTGGRWTGPILDNHFHLDKEGRYLDAALDFQRAGGTDLILVHKPDFDNLPTDEAGIKAAYSNTLEMAAAVRKQTDLSVRVVLGPHPAAWAHQIGPLGLEAANDLHLGAVQLALDHCAEGEAVGVGEIGRPHWEVGDEMMAEVPAQLHLDANGEQTYSEISLICDRARLPREMAIHHHAQADVSSDFTHGLIPSVIVGKGSIRDIAQSLWGNEGGFLMETDYMDDMKRPGAVLGPKTVPKRTQALVPALLGLGIDVESVLETVHRDLPNLLYGE